MADITTVAELGTAAGTLVLAVATFSAVRSSNRSARVAERTLLAGLQPLLLQSRPQDPVERVDFADGVVMEVPPGEAVIMHRNGAVLMAIAVRNVGTGLALLQGWHLRVGRITTNDGHQPPEGFRRLTRDIYVASNDTGFWQGAIRDESDPNHGDVRRALEARDSLTVEVLYTDQERARRFITRFTMTPHDEGWTATAGRMWALD